MNQQDAFQVWYLGFFGKPFPIEVGEQDYWIRVAWDAACAACRAAALEECVSIVLNDSLAVKHHSTMHGYRMAVAAAIRALRDA